MLEKEAKKFSEKQKGFRDGLLCSTPRKIKETWGNAITQPWSKDGPLEISFQSGLSLIIPKSPVRT